MAGTKRVMVAGLVMGMMLALSTNASALYLYAPNVLVIDSGDDADSYLDELEVSFGVEPSDDPTAADRPDFNRVTRIERVMDRHWQALDSECDNNAIFALMYLVTTRGIKAHIEQEFFDDNDYLSIITVAFAKYYLDAYEAWEDGDLDEVPAPWLEAFNYGAAKEGTISEDQFLGMNAHINYDLAMAIVDLGTTNADGESRKADMDRVNHVLADVTDDVGYWTAYYYGPEEPTEPPSDEHVAWTDDTQAVLAPVHIWRETAWRNAELIESSLTSTQRQLHIDSMEAHAYTVAQGFQTPKAEDPYPDRLEYCLTHG